MELGLKGKKVAILATDGVDDAELTSPRQALDMAGAVTELVSPKSDIQSKASEHGGSRYTTDRLLADVRAADYAALVLPGGAASALALRGDPRAVQFVREMMASDRPVAAICHGPQLLVAADAVGGRTLTSSPKIRAEIESAGGKWVDQAVQVDERLITSRRPDDLPAFNARIVREFAARIDERRVDQLSEQSFPASDPPAMP